HGEVMDVLCEGFDDEQQLWFGRTYADSVEVDGHVYFESDDTPQAGEFVPVLITESLGPDLLGVQQKGE
ncbi:MAG TPA: TRAM domain-containing protein, partial [Candidatus Agathobaculum merdigallinarum]|nr:TRAM domain-containing protein [Candidatus Agathobaculum merdigallinarum]